ncbi:MAG: MarR family transcriptional regulator [Kiloniellales bacterium]|nr:MarR family transcriptional regulator [Kiloniellales bacterium]
MTLEQTTRRRAAPSGPSASSRRRAAAAHDRTHEVLSALRRIIRATDLHSKSLFKTSGLTIPQVVVLQSIRDLGEVTTGQISARVNLSQATVTSILDRLENHHLIERYRSRSDRRVVHARLTKQGVTVLRRAPPLLHERFIEKFAALSHAKQEQFIRTLKEVADMMGAAHLDAAPLLDIAAPETVDKAAGRA